MAIECCPRCAPLKPGPVLLLPGETIDTTNSRRLASPLWGFLNEQIGIDPDKDKLEAWIGVVRTKHMAHDLANWLIENFEIKRR